MRTSRSKPSWIGVRVESTNLLSKFTITWCSNVSDYDGVRAYAIQASYTGGDAENVVEQARSAYQKYVDQNKNQPGQVTE